MHKKLQRRGSWLTGTVPAVLAVLAVALSTVVPQASAQDNESSAAPPPGPGGEEFYVPPAELPAGKPGDIVRWRPSDPGVFDDTADAWQVMYRSTDARGERNVVTGTVILPKNADPANTPIIGFGPGTQGPAFRCAPSKMFSIGAFYEQAALRNLIDAGYAVAMTDYEGYKPNPETTYVVGRSMGHALIDVVRAAQRLPAAGLARDAKTVFRGYSQGGGAAMWGGQLQPEYAAELNLAGVVAGGVPANLASVALSLNGGRGFGLLTYALIGLDNAYPDLNLENYLNENGRVEFGRMPEQSCTLDLLLRYRGDRLADYTTTSPIGTEKWLSAAANNKLGRTAIEVPVYQYHAANDQLVAPGQARQLRDAYCAKGVRLTWRSFDTDHLTLVARGNDSALKYIKDRIAGKPAGTTC